MLTTGLLGAVIERVCLKPLRGGQELAWRLVA